MTQRALLAAFASLCALPALVASALAAGSSPGTPGGVQVDLKVRLEKGLRARLPSEFAFIAKVVSLVNEGELPLKLVDRTFLWARKKPKNRVQYFKRALRILAARIGVDV